MAVGVLAPRKQVNTHDSPDTDAGASSLHHTLGAGASQGAAGNHSHLSAMLGYFGAGVDGSATLDGAVTPAWAGRAGSVYTLNRDANPLNLTINAGVTLKTNGFRLYVAGTLTNRGVIAQDGNDSTGQPAGNGAAVNATRTIAGSSGNGATGPSSGNGVAGTGQGTGPMVGGNGGAGGVSGGGANGGAGGTTSGYAGGFANSGPSSSLWVALWGSMPSGTALTSCVGGGGGGSGGCTSGGSTGAGGGGGGGGGIIVVAAATLDNAGGIIRAKGGNGGPGQLLGGTTGAGGGGGGGGGCVLVTYGRLVALGTISAPGGTGGAGAGTGAAGVNGVDGTAAVFSASTS